MSISQAVKDAAFAVARAEIDHSGYGSFVSDDKVRAFAEPIAEAAVRAALGETKSSIPNQPLAP